MCYNKDTKKQKKEVTTMNRYTIKHKHCGMVTHIEGYTVWDAFRSFAKDPKVWDIVAIEAM